MKGWTRFTLDNAPFEIIDGDRGKNYPSEGELFEIGDCLFLSTKNVRKHGFDFSSCQFIMKEKDEMLRKGKLQINDLVLTTRGTVGNIALYDKKVPYSNVRINSGMVIIRPDSERLDSKFLFYIFKFLQNEWPLFVSGSAQPQLPIKDIKNVEVSIPEINEQCAIASVLSSLDDKIDLLHRQNATLEAMAEALFKQWFVMEAKEEWDYNKLSYFGNIICGKTPSKINKLYFNGEIPFIKIPDMHSKIFINHTTDTLSLEGANSQKNKYIPKNSICVSCIATVGLVAISTQRCQTNQQINTIIPTALHYLYYLFLYLRSYKDELIALASGGTATLNLNTSDFSEIEIVTPPDDMLEIFHKKVYPIFNKIWKNQKQIHTLEKLRDSLLPKLMSGEVRVKF